jgi:hypothetical protein
VRGVSIDVLTWNIDRTREGVYLYATVGASRRTIGEAGSAHRIELISGFLPDEPGAARALALLAAYPALFNTALGHGHTVPYDEPVWPGTEMRSFLVTRPIELIVSRLELPDGSHVEFLTAIPVHPEEIVFKRAHGVEGLRATWKDHRVAFWDPRRPVPTLIEPGRGSIG